MQKRPEYEEMRLSDSFYHKVVEPQIEIICKVYNINPENNQTLKKEISSTGRLYIFCGKGKRESKAGNESGRSSGQCDKRLHR